VTPVLQLFSFIYQLFYWFILLIYFAQFKHLSTINFPIKGEYQFVGEAAALLPCQPPPHSMSCNCEEQDVGYSLLVRTGPALLKHRQRRTSTDDLPPPLSPHFHQLRWNTSKAARCDNEHTSRFSRQKINTNQQLHNPSNTVITGCAVSHDDMLPWRRCCFMQSGCSCLVLPRSARPIPQSSKTNTHSLRRDSSRHPSTPHLVLGENRPSCPLCRTREERRDVYELRNHKGSHDRPIWLLNIEFDPVRLRVFLTVCLSHCVSFSLCVFLPVCLSHCVSLSLCVFLTVCLSHCVSFCLCVFLTVSFLLCVFLTVCLSYCLSFSLCVFLTVCLS